MSIKNYEFRGYCFKINTVQIEYLLCNQDYQSLFDLKDKVEKQTIYSYLKKVLKVDKPPLFSIKPNFCVD